MVIKADYRVILVAIVITLFTINQSAMGVPHLISYQGKVLINGTPFNGSGLFRFAIVDSANYPWTTLYWSNDGNNPPLDDIQIDAENGIYSVVLGNGDQQSLPVSMFAADELYLVVWFDDGENGVQRLEPNQRITAVSFAIQSKKALNANQLDELDSSQFLRSDESDTISGDLEVTGSIVTSEIRASDNFSVATVDFDTLPNNAQNSGVTVGKLRAQAGQNNGQPYLWLRGNGAHSWILDHTAQGTDWAQSMGAYYNDVKQGNIGFFGNGPTVDYLSIGFGHPDWWNAHSKFLLWRSGRLQLMPTEQAGLSLLEPSAWLVLAPGTVGSAGAPLKFQDGQLMSNPEAGAVEWDGDRLYITDSNDTRKTVAYTDDPLQSSRGSNGITEKLEVVTEVVKDPITGELSVRKSTLIIQNGVITRIKSH